MTRKSWLASLTIIALLAGLVVATLAVLLRHEPAAYAQAAVPPGEERLATSKACEQRIFDLANTVINCQPEWEAEFTEQQVNSYLVEDFLRTKPIQLPGAIREPRVVLRPGRLTIGFRYGEGDLSGIVTIEAKVWLPRREPNVVALEIESLRAGALPLAVKVLQDELSEAARKLNIDVQWYRHDGNPVAVLRFQADRREPTVQLRELDLRYGSIYFKGRTTDPNPPTSKTAAKEQKE